MTDASYFAALLNTQSAQLATEVESLNWELERAEREQQNLLIYEQK